MSSRARLFDPGPTWREYRAPDVAALVITQRLDPDGEVRRLLHDALGYPEHVQDPPESHERPAP